MPSPNEIIAEIFKEMEKPAPSPREPQPPELTLDDHFVVYADILGFGNQIKAATSQKQLQDAYHMIRNVQKEFGKSSALPAEPENEQINDNYGKTVLALSDAVVVDVNLRCWGAHHMGEYDFVGWSIFDLVIAQVRCVCNGVFLRGGISVGPFFFGDDVLISPALARAYEIETTVEPPVIALTESTKDWVFNRKKKGFYAEGWDPTPRYFKKLGQQCQGEELYFLDYAGVMLNEENNGWLPEDRAAYQKALDRGDEELAKKIEFESRCKDAAFFFRWHKRRIEEGFKNARTEKTRAKYRWLMKYHNESFPHDLPYLKEQVIEMPAD